MPSKAVTSAVPVVFLRSLCDAMLVPSLVEGILVFILMAVGEGDGTHYVCCNRLRWNVDVTDDGILPRLVRKTFGFHNPDFLIGLGVVPPSFLRLSCI